jgi:hypothetical protein
VQCEICSRKSDGNFCKLHVTAYNNLLKNSEAWRKSMKISWTEYLTEIRLNEYTGIWVKEVAQYLLASISSNQPDSERTDSNK